MPLIWVKDLKQKENILVYQGPAVSGCELLSEEHKIMVWGGDPQGKEVAVRLLLTPAEAKKLAKQLLNQSVALEVGSDEA